MDLLNSDLIHESVSDLEILKKQFKLLATENCLGAPALFEMPILQSLIAIPKQAKYRYPPYAKSK